jgi:hypothetical protein
MRRLEQPPDPFYPGLRVEGLGRCLQGVENEGKGKRTMGFSAPSTGQKFSQRLFLAEKYISDHHKDNGDKEHQNGDFIDPVHHPQVKRVGSIRIAFLQGQVSPDFF